MAGDDSPAFFFIFTYVESQKRRPGIPGRLMSFLSFQRTVPFLMMAFLLMTMMPSWTLYIS